ncbi:MAG: ABC transporter ATP-binding protein/permease [Acholeplasmatales bacterium]|nr:ABC transporter ATP-binding protein/permease [Acholeplasmatales bacterium]
MNKFLRYTVILSILAFLTSTMLLCIPVISNFLIDEGQDIAEINSSDYDKLYFLIGTLITVLVVLVIIKYLEGLLVAKFEYKMSIEYKSYLYDKLLYKDANVLLKNHAGEIEQLFTTDINHLLRYRLLTIPNIIRQVSRLSLAIFLMILFVILGKIDWYIMLVTFALGIFGFVFARIYSHVIKPHHKKVLETRGVENSFLVESTQQIKLIEAYESQEYSFEHYKKLNKNTQKEMLKRDYIFNIASSGVYAFSNLVTILVLCYGAYFIAKGKISYGSLVFLLLILNNIQAPLVSFSSLLNQYSQAKTSDNRLNEFINLSKIDESLKLNDFEKIIFDDVSFTYDNTNDVIKNLSFEINKGETVLFKGPSGIGKTTIFMLMLGFIKPSSGKIILKTKDGEYEISNRTRSLFSYVPQENILFSGTILDNLYILTGKTKEDVIDALKKANIYDELMALPNGLDTKLNERGQSLSLGQIQRLLIAASIIKDNPILLLDEFTSSLDSENEDEIIDNLVKLNKTIIYITHRDKKIDKNKIISLQNNQ